MGDDIMRVRYKGQQPRRFKVRLDKGHVFEVVLRPGAIINIPGRIARELIRWFEPVIETVDEEAVKELREILKQIVLDEEVDPRRLRRILWRILGEKT